MVNTSQKLLGIVKDFNYIRIHKNIRDASSWLSSNIRNLFYNHIRWIVFTRNTNDSLLSYQLKLSMNYQAASLNDLALLEPFILPSQLEYFRNRLLNGRVCILALYQKQVAAYAWMTSDVKFLIDNINMQLKDGDAYIDDVYTFPAYRGQGVGKALNAHMIDILRDKGFKRAVAIVEINNMPSIKLHTSTGWQAIDHMTFYRFLSFRKYHYHNNSFG